MAYPTVWFTSSSWWFLRLSCGENSCRCLKHCSRSRASLPCPLRGGCRRHVLSFPLEGVYNRHDLLVYYLFIFHFYLCCLCVSKGSADSNRSVFPEVFGNLCNIPFRWLLHLLCTPFRLFSIFPCFEGNGLLLGCLMSSCQPAEVVLWSLLNIAMFFWVWGKYSSISLCHQDLRSPAFKCTVFWYWNPTLCKCYFVC